MAGCDHQLACSKCGASIGEIGLAAADADPDFEEALERAGAELAAELVSSVRCHPDGAHERVTVWLRGEHVGALLVGAGQGEALRRLLLSERIVGKARTLIRHWKDQDGFNSSIVDDLMSAIDGVDRLATTTEEVQS